MNQAVKGLDAVSQVYGHTFRYTKALIGACAIRSEGDPYPPATHAVCVASDAILFGAIGHPDYDNNPSAKIRPEQGLLRMRRDLGLFANVRPLVLFEALADRSPLRPEVIRGTDFVCVRELTGESILENPEAAIMTGQELSTPVSIHVTKWAGYLI